jgi:hypothetical protein
VSFGGESALNADNLDDFDRLVTEPDGIEPTTSSIPLSRPCFSDEPYIEYDTELTGFGVAVYRSGIKSWM